MNVMLVVPELVNVKVGFWAEELLMVELPDPPVGGEIVHVYCKVRGTPLHEGACVVLLEFTFNTEQPVVGVKVKAQVGGDMTHILSSAVSPPHPFAIVCVTV